jgi:hypothetical protein
MGPKRGKGLKIVSSGSILPEAAGRRGGSTALWTRFRAASHQMHAVVDQMSKRSKIRVMTPQWLDFEYACD